MFFEDLAMVMSIGGLILSVTILILSGIVDYIKKEYVIEKRNKGNSNTGEKRNYKAISQVWKIILKEQGIDKLKSCPINFFKSFLKYCYYSFFSLVKN